MQFSDGSYFESEKYEKKSKQQWVVGRFFGWIFAFFFLDFVIFCVCSIDKKSLRFFCSRFLVNKMLKKIKQIQNQAYQRYCRMLKKERNHIKTSSWNKRSCLRNVFTEKRKNQENEKYVLIYHFFFLVYFISLNFRQMENVDEIRRIRQREKNCIMFT